MEDCVGHYSFMNHISGLLNSEHVCSPEPQQESLLVLPG